jgi:2-oxoglutarate ferredoxin oxidoreductase subunit gamma
MSETKTTKVLFAGEGGQGVQAVAEILAKAAFKQGLKSAYIPNFGVEQRGGVSLAFVIISFEPIIYPKFREADILAIFSDRSIERVRPHLGPRTQVVLGPAVKTKQINGAKSITHLDGQSFPHRAWNILVLGKINQIGNLVDVKALTQAMDERFKHYYQKNPSLREANQKAINHGL